MFSNMTLQGQHLLTRQTHMATSTDEHYFNRYFDRWHGSFTRLWQWPMHCHVVDPSPATLSKLARLSVSHTWSTTNHINWHDQLSLLRSAHGYAGVDDQHLMNFARNTLCQSMRFYEMCMNFDANSSVIIADIDAHAQHPPTESQWRALLERTAFSLHNQRLMATLCHFHGRDHGRVAHMLSQLEQRGLTCPDQLVIKQAFGDADFANLDQAWIRHQDIKTEKDAELHGRCLVFHAKGTRGKKF